MSSQMPEQKLYVGIKQATKAVKSGKTVKAYVANDIDNHMRNSFVKLCKQSGVTIEVVRSAGELGVMCGIEIGASVAVVTEGE